MKIHETVWFTNKTTTGLIIAENDVGDIHAYIGTGFGIDEKTDIQHILDNGTKTNIDVLANMFNKYRKKK